MIINDIVCGALLVILGFLSLNPFRVIAQLASGLVGFWLCLAPLVFHAETAVAYTTNTLAGILVMSFVLVIPNIPGIKLISYEGPNVPPGWSYNPSSWGERIPVIFLGWAGFFTARYLAGYQMGYSETIWDPFFGEGTVKVLTSKVSESFPVSDAGLGAFAYILDVIMGLAGKTARWRTMPWVVLIFGFLVIPLGIVSTTLIILQPLSVGSWCTACLLSALITIGMIPFTFDEVLASIQYLDKKRKQGESLWRVFWLGGDIDEGSVKHYTKSGNRQVLTILNGMWEDLLIKPWNLFVSIIMGLWFMVSPGIVQLNFYVLNRNDYAHARREFGRVWKSLCGRHYPAMAMFQVVSLYDPLALIEIQGIAAR
jgi:hypothetical protein